MLNEGEDKSEMRIVIKKLIYLLASMTAASGIVVAASGKSSTQSIRQLPLNLAATSLPPSFKGNDCRVIAKVLSGAKLEKGEFETTEQYRSRVDAFREKAYIPGLNESASLGFVVAVKSENVSYDADAGRMSVEISDELLGSSAGSMAEVGFTADARIVSQRNYVGSNAYGKTVKIRETYANVCAIRFVDKTYDPLKNSLSVPIDVAPEQAKSLKKNLALLYAGVLAEPFLEKYSAYSKPTVDHPYEYAWGGDTIDIDLYQIWLFDLSNGKVYQKIDQKN